jgi:hypothetical protein
MKGNKRWAARPIVGLVATLLAGSVGQAMAGISVSPAQIRASLDRGRPSGTIVLTNTGDAAERYRVQAIYFQINEEGGFQVRPPDETSLAPWIRFNPAEVEIGPNERRTVRYSILAPKNLGDGEYWGAIEFEPLQASGEVKQTDTEGRKFNLKVFTSVLVSVFATRGTPRAAVEALADLEVGKDSPVLNLRVKNTGTMKVDVEGRYELRGSGQVITQGDLPRQALLRGGRRVFHVPVDPTLGAGQYTVRVMLEGKQLEKPVEAELTASLAAR